MRYRKKPVVIEAVQWTGENLSECKLFLGESYISSSKPLSKIFINTLEGQLTASKGDYLIRGVRGEHYSCKPDIFELTYESAQENNK